MGIEKANAQLGGLSEGLEAMLITLNEANAAFYGALSDVRQAIEESQAAGKILGDVHASSKVARARYIVANDFFVTAEDHLLQAGLPDYDEGEGPLGEVSRSTAQYSALNTEFTELQAEISNGGQEVSRGFMEASQTLVAALGAALGILADERQSVPELTKRTILAHAALNDYMQGEKA